MGNSWTSNDNRRDCDKNWSPYADGFGAFGRKKNQRWSLRKPKGYYKTVSELDLERGLPSHLHYQSPNSVEEDLFTIDTRSPCVIHLHQRTRQDINHILRGSSAYSKVARPKSFDPRLLLDSSFPYEDDLYSPQSPRNSSFISSSAHLNTKARPDLETSPDNSEQSMRIDSSGGQGDIVKVDTSGAKFDRQANLRRSHRLSTSGVRQRANAAQRRQLRHKHKTLTALPGNISSELGETPHRPHSSISRVTSNSSETRSFIAQDHCAVSSRQVHHRNVEIQTDDVKVIPLTPAQKRMRQKVFSSSNSSPTSSQGSTKYLESPTAVSCQTVPMMKHTSTPINEVFEKELIRPSSLDVNNIDTSTDEGRHTGESNPPTPVRTGTPQELLASPQLKKSPNSPVKTVENIGSHDDKPEHIALRINGGRFDQAEDRTSSGCWSGTESVQHSSSSDITMHHAPVMQALQQALKNDRLTPKFANSAGKVSPIVDNKPMVISSAVSSSTVSINSKLSTLDIGTSNSSLCRDSDDRFESPNSSVISVAINRSHHASNASLASSEPGRAISAASMVKKTRKARLNGTGGEYNFMNYESDPLEIDTIETRVLKNRRSTRSTKRSKKRGGGEDTVSLSSMADSSPRHTEADTMSAYSGGKIATDAASLSGSTYSGDQDERSSPLRSEQAHSKCTTPGTPTTSTPETLFAKALTPAGQSPSTPNDTAKHSPNGMYDSYHRAIKSNHAPPKSLLTSRQSASVKVPKHLSQPAIDFQSELNRRLSLRPVDEKKLKKSKRGAPPPPPKRASSLSSSCCPSPSPSLRSAKFTLPNVNSPPPNHSLSIEEYYRSTPPPQTPTATPSPSRKAISPLVMSPKSLPVTPSTAPLSRKAISPIVAPKSPTRKQIMSHEFYQSTPPPPPPIDQLPPPPPELLTPIEESQPIVPVTTPSDQSEPKSPVSPKSPTLDQNSPMQSIAMQAALLGSRRSTKKKPSSETAESTSLASPQKANDIKKSSSVIASESNINSPKQDANSVQHTIQNSTTAKQTVNAKYSSPTPFGNEILQQKNKLRSHSMKPKPPLVSQPAIDEETKPDSPKSQSETIQNSPTSPEGNSKTTFPKTRPAVAPKGFYPSKIKIPPHVSSKPSLVSPRTDVKGNFDSKRTREQSPSYRSSLARAAFFGSVSSTQSDSCKPAKVPLVTSQSSQEECSSIKNGDVETKEPTTTDSKMDQSEVLKSDQSVPSKSEQNSEDSNDSDKEPIPPEQENADSPEEFSNTWMDQLEVLSPTARKETAPVESAASKLGLAKSTPSQKYSNYDNLMAAIHKSRRETLSGKSTGASPPTSPGVNGDAFTYRTNGNGSPSSTLDRKRNGRLSSNGQLNAISRKSNGATSRDNFKALLLQNACRGSFSSQMSATEKLNRNKPTNSAISRLRPSKSTDADKVSTKTDGPENGNSEENGSPELSLNEIRSAMTSGSATTSRIGRTNRRGARPNGTEPKYATMSFHGKKHPPPSSSSKYNTRSRTPTRPMMSISEDNENEKSPELKSIKSIVDQDT